MLASLRGDAPAVIRRSPLDSAGNPQDRRSRRRRHPDDRPVRNHRWPMHAEPRPVSEQLEGWLRMDGKKTLGGFVDLFEQKSFAILFVLLLAVPALPLPTGGATHVLEIIAALLALELIVGRKEIWLPQRWRDLEMAGPRQQRFLERLMRMIRRLERFSRPRLRFLF